MDLICIYRFSDGGQSSPDGQKQAKPRPDYFNKRPIFLNFLQEFGSNNLTVIADNITEDSYTFLSKYISSENIIRTDLKSGALSFLYSVQHIINTYKSIVSDSTPIYLVEDDYIHRSFAKKILLEGLKISDYVTLYDHPDKYINPQFGGNPYVINGGERTIVNLTESAHWKITNSTTMTFATKIGILIQDFPIYHNYCHTGYPYDFQMFLELGKQGRKLISSIPGYSTHCENGVLAPLYNWQGDLESVTI
jgi:hypothetical protein